MICDICGENNAVIHLHQKQENGETSLNLCEKCAHENGLEMGPGGDADVAKILEKLSMFSQGITRKDLNVVCDKCGTTLAEVKKSGTVGCSHCYDMFREHIEKYIAGTLDKALYSVSDKKEPPMREPMSEDAYRNMLEKQMQEAVAVEDYENAAVLRDKIRAISK
ncbi:MAG: UvrB/UvrC motif-containing protein [Spirochaetia bacterium]|nr:UvrB/UvrC motif-containing protein [Spirochaetia bacterium]